MNLVSLTFLVAIFVAILIAYRSVGRAFGQRRISRAETGGRRNSTRTPGSQLHWIDAAELKRLIDVDPDLVVFHLIHDERAERKSQQFRGEIGITLPQLEEALAWMPRGTRFAVYRVNGISPSLAERLTAITRGRKAFFLAGGMPRVLDGFDRRMAGQICS